MAKLGKATFEPTGSFKNKEILSKLNSYKKVVSNSYTLISGDEIAGRLNMPLLTSTKIDGEQWFLLNDSEWKLVTATGKVIRTTIRKLLIHKFHC